MITNCDQVLKIESLNEKALYRKATAEIDFGLYDEAKRTIKTLVEDVSSSPPTFASETSRLKQRLKQKEAMAESERLEKYLAACFQNSICSRKKRNKKPKSDEEKMNDAETALTGLGEMMKGSGGGGGDEEDWDASQKPPMPLNDLLDDFQDFGTGPILRLLREASL